MKDKEFLVWLRNRMINVYGESPNVSFLHTLNGIIESTNESSMSSIVYELKDASPKDKNLKIIKDLDLVPVPDIMISSCPQQFPGIKIYRNYHLPKLDSEDLFETYERIMGVHPLASIEKGDMIKRKDLKVIL